MYKSNGIHELSHKGSSSPIGYCVPAIYATVMTSNASKLYDEFYDFYEYHNGSIGDLAMAIEHRAPSMVTFAVILTIWTYFINILVIIVILSDFNTRNKLTYLQIVNMSATNIVSSMVVIPLTIYYELKSWTLGLALCKAYIILDVMLPFISIIAILFMDIAQLMNNLRICQYPTTSFVKFVQLTLPWLIGMIVVVTLWTLGEMPVSFAPGLCLIMLTFEASVTSPILTFFIPGLFCIICTTSILITNLKNSLNDTGTSLEHSRNTDIYTNQGTSLQTPLYQTGTVQHRKSSLSVITVCLVNFTWIALWFPNKFVTFQLPFCNDCFPPIPIVVAFVWLGASASGIVPLMLFSDSNIRHITRNCFTGVFTRKQNSEETNIIDLDEMSTNN